MAAKEKKKEHPLHKRVAKYIRKYIEENGKSGEYKVIIDHECVANDCEEHLQRIPLFCSEEKGRETEYCNVDMMIVKKKPKDRISVLIEIEESGISPTDICGKFLTSALSSHYIHKTNTENSLPLVPPIWFLQIVDISSLKDNSRKEDQFECLQKSIQEILPLPGSAIREYNLICVDETNVAIESEIKDKLGVFLKEILD